MEVLMSNWSKIQSLPENYIFPADRRPGKHIFPVYKDVPIIDLQKARPQLVQDILKASQDFGFFQVSFFVSASYNLYFQEIKLFNPI